MKIRNGKWLVVFLVLVLGMGVMFGCGGRDESQEAADDEGKDAMLEDPEEDSDGTSEEGDHQEIGDGRLGKIYFLETAVIGLETLNFDGRDDSGVRTSDIFAEVELEGDVYFRTIKEFDKYEDREIFLENYILIEGESTPAFGGPELSEDMHVRDLIWMNSGPVGMLSVEQAMEIFEMNRVEEDMGVLWMDLLIEYSLDPADRFLLESSDGFSAEVSFDDLEKGILYINERGEVATRFEGLSEDTAIKELLLIESLSNP